MTPAPCGKARMRLKYVSLSLSYLNIVEVHSKTKPTPFSPTATKLPISPANKACPTPTGYREKNSPLSYLLCPAHKIAGLKKMTDANT